MRTRPVPPANENRLRARWRGPTKFATTSVFAVRVTWHVPVPEQAPDQPTKTESGPATGTRVTASPIGRRYEQYCASPGALIWHRSPEGLTCTPPRPSSPITFTVNVRAMTKVAVTFRASDIVTWHVVSEPVQAPDQPSRTEGPSIVLWGKAYSVTTSPWL